MKHTFLSTCLFFATIALAQPQKLQIKRIAVFQNDVALVVKEGHLKFENQSLLLDGIPDSSSTNYWLGTTEDFNIQKVTFGLDTIFRASDVKDFFDLLRANVGSVAEVTYQIGNEVETITGEVQPFWLNSEIASIKKANGTTVFVKKEQIQQVAVHGAVKTKYNQKMIGQTTKIQIDKPISYGTIQLLYYQTGISWVPQYFVKLISDSVCTFSLKALVTNNNEDLEETELQLVMGNANAKESPNLTKVKSISNQITYNLGKINLKNNNSSMVNVLNQKIDVGVINECKIPNYFKEFKDLDKPISRELKVYKSIKFDNKTGVPLASGKVTLIDKSERSIGNDSLPFTQSDSQVSLKVSENSNLSVSYSEEDIDFVAKAKKVDGKNYDKYKFKGMLIIKNTAEEEQNIQILKEFYGKMARTSYAEVIKTNEQVEGNPVMNVKWNVPIPAKNSISVPFEYEFFAPSQN